jgi:hypothetical protein
MSSNIKDLARKKLWALSAGRCAICKKELVGTDKLNIGQECHIISPKPFGPRYMPNLDDYNNYDNFILLCANHHREIDTDVKSYSVDKLKQIKKEHEQSVKKSLKEHNQEVEVLAKIHVGDTLGNMIFGSHSWTIEKEINNPFAERVSMDLEELIENMMNLQIDLDFQDKMEFNKKLNDYIKILGEHNLGLYADVTKKNICCLEVPSVNIAILESESSFCVIKRNLLTI